MENEDSCPDRHPHWGSSHIPYSVSWHTPLFLKLIWVGFLFKKGSQPTLPLQPTKCHLVFLRSRCYWFPVVLPASSTWSQNSGEARAPLPLVLLFLNTHLTQCFNLEWKMGEEKEKESLLGSKLLWNAQNTSLWASHSEEIQLPWGVTPRSEGKPLPLFARKSLFEARSQLRLICHISFSTGLLAYLLGYCNISGSLLLSGSCLETGNASSSPALPPSLTSM